MNAHGTNNQALHRDPLQGFSFSRRLGIVAAVGALASLTASSTNPEHLLDGGVSPLLAIKPKVSLIPSGSPETWSQTTERREPGKENWGCFDWVHRDTPGKREHFVNVQITYTQPQKFELRVASRQDLLSATTNLNRHEQWKDVVTVIPPGRVIQEHNNDMQERETIPNPQLRILATALANREVKPTANVAWQSAKRFAREHNATLQSFELELIPNAETPRVKGQITLATDSGPKRFDATGLENHPALRRAIGKLGAGLLITFVSLE